MKGGEVGWLHGGSQAAAGWRAVRRPPVRPAPPRPAPRQPALCLCPGGLPRLRCRFPPLPALPARHNAALA